MEMRGPWVLRRGRDASDWTWGEVELRSGPLDIPSQSQHSIAYTLQLYLLREEQLPTTLDTHRASEERGVPYLSPPARQVAGVHRDVGRENVRQQVSGRGE